MTQKYVDKLNKNGIAANNRPDPEVLPQPVRAKRRTFTAAYKQWVVEEAEKCREQPGGIGALLREEGLYSSHLTTLRLRSGQALEAAVEDGTVGRIDTAPARAEKQSRGGGSQTVAAREYQTGAPVEESRTDYRGSKKLSEILGITLERELGDEA